MLDWDTSLNHEMDPERITDGSHVTVMWKCHKCSREWEASVNRRTLLNFGCICDAMERKKKSLQTDIPLMLIYYWFCFKY